MINNLLSYIKEVPSLSLGNSVTRLGLSSSVLLNSIGAIAFTIFAGLALICYRHVKHLEAQITQLSTANADAQRINQLAQASLENVRDDALAAKATAVQANEAAQQSLATVCQEWDAALAAKTIAEQANETAQQSLATVRQELKAALDAQAAVEQSSTIAKQLPQGLRDQRISSLPIDQQIAYLAEQNSDPLDTIYEVIEDYLPKPDLGENKENLDASITEYLDHGKVKQVWIKKNKDTSFVYFTTSTEAARLELVDEVKKCQAISTVLKKKYPKESEIYLAVDLEEAVRPIRDPLTGTMLYTVQSKRADLNLEKHIRNTELLFATRLKLACQVLQGLSYLHEAGYIQGDLKPENMLVYGAITDAPTVRISDFGKALDIKANPSPFMKGNPRFSAPEFRATVQGEVYGAALIVIRVLEEAILQNKAALMEIPNPKGNAVLQRRGVEKYLVEHPSSMQFDQWNAVQGATTFFGSYVWSPSTNAEKAIHSYVESLCSELQTKNHLSVLGAKQLGSILKQMTLNDPAKRPCMAHALEAFSTFI